MIYKSTQPYGVQLQQQAIPSVNMSHLHESSLDMDTISMYMPNSTFAYQPPADMWSGIAHPNFELQNQSSNLGPAYQSPYDTFHQQNYPSSQDTTSPMLTAPYTEPTSTHTTSPLPAFSNSPGSPIPPADHQQDGIRLSTWVGEYESRHHQPLALETGPFKK
jgi:hypothetical protein